MPSLYKKWTFSCLLRTGVSDSSCGLYTVTAYSGDEKLQKLGIEKDYLITFFNSQFL